MTVDTNQKYQEKVESPDNILCQPKQRDHINKEHDDMYIPYAEEVLYVSSYPML